MPKPRTSAAASSASNAGLLTPAPSSEIQAKSVSLASPVDSSFALPPAAISSTPNTRTPSIISSGNQTSDSSYSPVSPPPSGPKARNSSTSKRKSSASNGPNSQQMDYTLPPPPTRNRKIIQMRPRNEQDEVTEPLISTKSTNTRGSKSQTMIAPAVVLSKNSTTTTITATGTNPPSGTKRKQPSGPPNTAAGRKMARKTAHSLIERRRRSKMNEEFGVLKDMIPACTGQEMHKLAILQASIEYMRYLESCLSDLKSAHDQCPSVPTHPSTHPSTRSSSVVHQQDTDMKDLPPIRQVLATAQQNAQQNTQQNPSVLQNPFSHPQPPQQSSRRLPSISPTLPPMSHSPHTRANSYAYLPPPPTGAGSALSSPVFTSHAHSGFAPLNLTSPVIAPQSEDQEATAALLLLNTDRRSWSERGSASSASASGGQGQAGGGRSMSVRDLLTN
ncbi:hypothetical protein BT63DRAFT_441459 [Microthyrium microscopicum]|uniref:BHLH domain-containing protein n=1 Tax=Microthyrium microscopicum TaxID=703497 RepID=A0A6A6U8G7_9PEZI|nr:hypothetical protein BT63DRAFT_441459 [Microthyrium microscopicum]